MGITVGKILFVFSFILGILVVPTEVYAVIMHSFFFFFEGGGGGREQTRYILGNRKSASGELLNEIAVTEGNLGTSC